MSYFETRSFDPYFNLAFEEFLLEETGEEGVMLWQNAPSVILGANQDAAQEIDLAYAEAHGIRIVRRKSGGGAVYHDSGNINYSFFHTEKTASLDFSHYVAPIVRALAPLGIALHPSGRNDLVCADGRKVSGVAQRRCGERVLFHGTLLFDTDVEVLSRVLTPPEEKLQRHSVKSVSARVCNLRPLLHTDFDTASFFSYLREALSDGTPPRLPSAGFEKSARVRAFQDRSFVFSL